MGEGVAALAEAGVPYEVVPGITFLGVHIEQAGRHPATLAVGLSTGCWAHRRGLIRIDSEINYEILTHKGATI